MHSKGISIQQMHWHWDLGINNLVSGVSSKGETFIIDGRRLKSINQWFNKKNARLQSIKDKQHFGKEDKLGQR